MAKKHMRLTLDAANALLQEILDCYAPESNVHIRVRNMKEATKRSDLIGRDDPVITGLRELIRSGSGKEATHRSLEE